MSKLRLDLDGLVVESFATDGGTGRFGTVHAHESIVVNPSPDTISRRSDNPADCTWATCANMYSCWIAMFSGCCTNDADYTCDTEVLNCIRTEPETVATD